MGGKSEKEVRERKQEAWECVSRANLKLNGAGMRGVKCIEQEVCVGAGICRRWRRKRLPVHWVHRDININNTHSLALFTPMWEELGVYLLEGVLIYYTTWALLMREGSRKTVGMMEI